MASIDFAALGSNVDPQDVLTDLLGTNPDQAAYEAVQKGDERLVQETSVNLQGLSTIRPKIKAAEVRRLDLLRLLLEKDSTITEDLVATACKNKDLDCIRMLLEFGWPINRAIYSVASLLYFAIGDKIFMQSLIEQGADVDARSSLDEPVLAAAIVDGSIEVIYSLLEFGADTTHGNLLHCAAERNNHEEGAELVEYLTQKGADVNAYRHDNSIARRLRGMSKLLTPLHVACNQQNLPVAQALLRHGADPNRLALEAGQLVPPTAFESAKTSKNKDLINLLSTKATN